MVRLRAQSRSHLSAWVPRTWANLYYWRGFHALTHNIGVLSGHTRLDPLSDPLRGYFVLVTLNLQRSRDLGEDLDSLVAYVTSQIMLILRPPAHGAAAISEMSSSLTEMLDDRGIEGSIGDIVYVFK